MNILLPYVLQYTPDLYLYDYNLSIFALLIFKLLINENTKNKKRI